MSGAHPSFTGNCFYAGGGTFRAQLFGQVWNEEQRKFLKVRYTCNEPLVLEVLRQAFELLVSSEPEGRIGSQTVRKMQAPGTGLPVVAVEAGRTIYQLTQSKSGSGAARLQVFLPFATMDEDIDLSEVAKEADLPSDEEGEPA